VPKFEVLSFRIGDIVGILFFHLGLGVV
jgi:hypothetical protein